MTEYTHINNDGSTHTGRIVRDGDLLRSDDGSQSVIATTVFDDPSATAHDIAKIDDRLAGAHHRRRLESTRIEFLSAARRHYFAEIAEDNHERQQAADRELADAMYRAYSATVGTPVLASTKSIAPAWLEAARAARKHIETQERGQ